MKRMADSPRRRHSMAGASRFATCTANGTASSMFALSSCRMLRWAGRPHHGSYHYQRRVLQPLLSSPRGKKLQFTIPKQDVSKRNEEELHVRKVCLHGFAGLLRCRGDGRVAGQESSCGAE